MKYQKYITPILGTLAAGLFIMSSIYIPIKIKERKRIEEIKKFTTEYQLWYLNQTSESELKKQFGINKKELYESLDERVNKYEHHRF